MAEGPAFYDAAIAIPVVTVDDGDEPHLSPHLLPPLEGPYAELYETVTAMIAARPLAHVLDLGCGTGRFASLVLPRTGKSLSYTGYDFSPGMIAEARRFNNVAPNAARSREGQTNFACLDLRDTGINISARPDEPLVIVCLETLEHLDNDIRLLARLPLEARLIVSVPSFDSAAHVRHFPNIGDALDRYQDVMEIDTWKPVWLPERTGYFHLITGRVRP